MIYFTIRRVWGLRGFCYEVWLIAAGQMTRRAARWFKMYLQL